MREVDGSREITVFVEDKFAKLGIVAAEIEGKKFKIVAIQDPKEEKAN